jgi:hypothetical protein
MATGIPDTGIAAAVAVPGVAGVAWVVAVFAATTPKFCKPVPVAFAASVADDAFDDPVVSVDVALAFAGVVARSAVAGVPA